MTRALVVALVILGAASLAEARPKIPKALAGIELADGEGIELLWARHDRTFTLGGAEVIAFRQRFRWNLPTVEGEWDRGTTTQLALAVAATKVVVFRVDIEADLVREHQGLELGRGKFAYQARWRDENGDGEDELALTRTSDDAAQRRIFQLRFGRLVEMTPELVRCPRVAEDAFEPGETVAAGLAPTMAKRFVARLDDGDPPDEVLCAYVDAVATAQTEAVMPAPGETITVAPVATGCPGLDWALRHGRTLTPSRLMAFVDTAGHLARVQVRNHVLSVTTIDLTESAFGVGDVVWLERWVIDDRLWVFAEVSGKVERFAIVYDPYRDDVHTWRLDEHETVRLVHTTGTTGHFELRLDGLGGKKTLWKREATSWH